MLRSGVARGCCEGEQRINMEVAQTTQRKQNSREGFAKKRALIAHQRAILGCSPACAPDSSPTRLSRRDIVGVPVADQEKGLITKRLIAEYIGAQVCAILCLLQSAYV